MIRLNGLNETIMLGKDDSMCRKYLAILFCCLFCFTGTVWAEEELSSDEEQALIVSGFIEDMVDPEISVAGWGVAIDDKTARSKSFTAYLAIGF